MKFSQSILFVAIAAALTGSSDAFVSQPQVSTQKVSSTEVHVFDFLKDGKKKLVKSLAGEYDEAAVKARMEGLIGDNPVLMFSFTT
jgi:hypothetical protein